MDRAETEAIREVLGGNRDAYRVLMDRHFSSVARVTFRITGNEEDAEEAAQEAFLRAYNKLPSFRLESAFSTWIVRIAMNTAINLVERRKRDLTYRASRIADEPSAADGTVRVADRQAGPEDELLGREAATLRETAMGELTPMERAAFTMRHMEEVPMMEIAEALNITVNSAKQAVFRAVSKLRRSLAPVAGGLR
ncbi:RNA polymerase sigma factor [Granulicella sp. S190]|uniref:RNA polymerase sigma factor n=1 Tax=Granulicella sp. S190 TaxID=1747226 RepID=UPI00131D37DA|nr:sigma-70 family RNA polymerase sigma factor [Granulicella sp. S190]